MTYNEGIFYEMMGSYYNIVMYFEQFQADCSGEMGWYLNGHIVHTYLKHRLCHLRISV